MTDGAIPVGLVLRASSRGFAVGCRVMQQDVPRFGAFVRVEVATSSATIYGLIYDVAMEDDLLARRVALIESPQQEAVLDQQDNRLVPIEVSVLSVGCREGERITHCIPPQPPVTLHTLYLCDAQEIAAFTRRLDYFRLVLGAPDVPADELLAASLRAAAAARPADQQTDFFVQAGRELARLLPGDLLRLDGLLRRLQAARA